MKIDRRTKWNATQSNYPMGARRREAGHALSQLLGSGFLFGMALVGFSGAIATAFVVIQCARQDLYASRLLMQRAESLKLVPAGQLADADASGKPIFVETEAPAGLLDVLSESPKAGGMTPTVPVGGDPAQVSRLRLRSVTLNLCSTSGTGEKRTVHTSQAQVWLARNGVPKYVWPEF